MRLWVIETKPEGGEWELYEAHESEYDARWVLDFARRRHGASQGFRLVQYAPVRKAKK